MWASALHVEGHYDDVPGNRLGCSLWMRLGSGPVFLSESPITIFDSKILTRSISLRYGHGWGRLVDWSRIVVLKTKPAPCERFWVKVQIETLKIKCLIWIQYIKAQD
ncbi:hypothetical protein DITRI_Ditri09bG0109100 [Diplodiscus trichospermus]